jgi:hypothetical protein
LSWQKRKSYRADIPSRYNPKQFISIIAGVARGVWFILIQAVPIQGRTACGQMPMRSSNPIQAFAAIERKMFDELADAFEEERPSRARA